jgi:S1-C subfamily serine protease
VTGKEDLSGIHGRFKPRARIKLSMKIRVPAVAVLVAALMSCGPEGPAGRSRSSRSDALVSEALTMLTSENLDIAVAEVDGAGMVPSLRRAEALAAKALKLNKSYARAASLSARLKARISFYSEKEESASRRATLEACLTEATEALHRGRTEPGVWIDRAVVSLSMMGFEREKRAEELRQNAVDDLTYALKLDPGSTDALYCRAFARTAGVCWPFKPSPTSFREDMMLSPPEAEVAARSVELLSAAESDLLDMKHLEPDDPRIPEYLDYVGEKLGQWRKRLAAVSVMTPGQVFDAWKDSVVLLESDKGSGTGFVVAQAPNTPHGTLILTNRHVVESATRRFVRVYLKDGRVLPGRVAKLSSDRDLAIVDTFSAENFGLPKIVSGADAVSIGSRGEELVDFAEGENAARVGDRIVVIGHPGALGEQGRVVMLSWTLTEGTVSAYRDNGNLLQHDAPTNPGNSGGPILDLHGRVVGIVQSGVVSPDPRLPVGSTLEGVGLGETAANAKAFLLQTTKDMAEGVPRPVAAFGRPGRYQGWIDFQADMGKTYTLTFETEEPVDAVAKLYAYEGDGQTLLDSEEGPIGPGQPLTLTWTCLETGWYFFALLKQDGTAIRYTASLADGS